MIPTIIISVITSILIVVSIIFFPNIKIGKIKIDTYWIIALLGALILLIFQFAPIKEVFNQLTKKDSINPIKIIILFFSMTIISIFLDELGLFHYLACLATRKAKGNQYLLFGILYFLTAVLTIFTSNDIVILTLTPFICFFCKNSKINPLPYLISEFVAANTWSLMLIIGNPTNIYLATSAGINFASYFKVMWFPTLIAGVVEVLILYLLFWHTLHKPIYVSHDDYRIESKFDLIIGTIHLGICLILLVISSYINLEMWIIAASCALSLLIVCVVTRLITKKHWNYVTGPLKRLPYQLIPFFLSMFVIVVAVNYQGISTKIAGFFGDKHTIYIYGYSSFFMSNIINNIPMSILYSSLPVHLPEVIYKQAIYSSIIGSNIGAFLTPIGALAGIMFSSLVNEHEVKFSFLDFIKYGVIIAIPTISIALLMLDIMI